MPVTTSVLGSTYLFGGTDFSSATENRENIKEDVLDLVVNIDPFDTPFVTMAPKTQGYGVVHEWISDTLAATSTASGSGGANDNFSAWPEGASFSANQVADRPRNVNWMQIFRKDIQVSNTMRAVTPIGLRDEYSYQIMKGTREIARDLEATVWRPAGSATGTTAAGRLMKVLEEFLVSNSAFSRGVALGNSATNAVSSAFPIFENDLNSMLELIYTSGGNPDSVFVSPAVKRYMSKYGGNMGVTGANAAPEIRRVIDDAEKRLVRAVNVYESDFGPIQFVIDRWIPQATNTASTGSSTVTAASASDPALRGRMFFLERTRNRLVFLRPIRHIPLPPGGDHTRGMVVGELTLEVLAEKGSGFIRNVNNRDS